MFWHCEKYWFRPSVNSLGKPPCCCLLNRYTNSNVHFDIQEYVLRNIGVFIDSEFNQTNVVSYNKHHQHALNNQTRKPIQKFRWCRWGSSLSGLHTLDPLLSPTSTVAEIFWHTCLGGRGQEKLNNFPFNFLTVNSGHLVLWQRTQTARTKISFPAFRDSYLTHIGHTIFMLIIINVFPMKKQ